jgi:hypothetical protein
MACDSTLSSRLTCRPRDHLQALVSVCGKVRAREGGHADARKRTPRHGREPKVLVGRTPLGRGHLAPVALEDFRERESLRDPAIDDDALVDVGFDVPGPLLGLGLVIKGPGLRRQASAANLYTPEWATFLEGRHGTVSLSGVSRDRATGTVPELSQIA